MELVNAILKYEFLQNAYLVGILIGAIAPIIGCYVIIRRLSIVVEGIAHISVTGIAFAFLLISKGVNVPITIMAIIFAVFGGVILEVLSSSFKNYKEISVPILISFSVATMILFIGFTNNINTDINSYLFGNILTATKLEIYVLLAVFIIFYIFIFKNFYNFVAFSIDSDYCKFNNLSANRYKWFMTVVMCLVVAISIKAVGMLLVSALVILPVSTAMKFSTTFKKTMVYGVLLSEVAVVLGLTFAYYLNISSGATIIYLNIILFVIVTAITKIKGNL